MTLITLPSAAAGSVEFLACSMLGRVETLPVERSASVAYVSTFVQHMLPAIHSDASWSLTLMVEGFAAHVLFEAPAANCACKVCSVGAAVALRFSWLSTSDGGLLHTEVCHAPREVPFVDAVDALVSGCAVVPAA